MVIDPKTVRQTAEDSFKAGQFYCSEAIINAVRENIAPDMPKEMIAMASGFPVGIGRTKCSCGALTGAVLTMGYFFGRTEGTTPQDPKSVKSLELAKELQEYFRANNKITCCSVLTRGMDMASGEHKAQCVRFTGEMAEKLAEILKRELETNEATD